MELGVHFIDFLPGDSSPHTPTCGTPGRRPQKSSRTRSPCCTAIATPRDAIPPRSARPQRAVQRHLWRSRRISANGGTLRRARRPDQCRPAAGQSWPCRRCPTALATSSYPNWRKSA